MIWTYKHLTVFFIVAFNSVHSLYSLQWNSGNEGRVQWAQNCAYNGNDVERIASRDFECGALCVQSPRCTRFTWHPENGGTCRFKSGNDGLYAIQNGGVCGYVVGTTEATMTWNSGNEGRILWTQNCDYAGNDLGSISSKDFECGRLCLENNRCTRFTWTPANGGTCRFRSGNKNPFATQNSGVCGYVTMQRSTVESNTLKRKSEKACEEYTGIASHYRIFRGQLTHRDEFPWMAALGYREQPDGRIKFRCGGTIISDYYVLSAAHCVEAEPVLAQLGTRTLNGAKKVNMLVESWIKHKDFNFEAHKNDIALIKLEQRITFGDSILPACLRVDINDLPSNQQLIVTGWGQTEDGTLSSILRKTTLYTVGLRDCKTKYLKKGSAAQYRISDNQYCAEDSVFNTDACRGDSGGPLQVLDNTPLASVVGVTSFGDPKCQSEYPGIYTRVASFLEWIEDNVWYD